ncbi:MAG: twin-arginine translocation signal domain-containing protein [Verrucomicrobiales bacterium]
MTTPDSTSFSRRSFLRGSAAAAAAGAFAVPAFGIKPIGRAGQPRFPLSLAAYSFRGHFAFMKDKPQKPADPAKPLDMFGFLDFCADLGIAGAELTSYFFKAGRGRLFLGAQTPRLLAGCRDQRHGGREQLCPP